MAFRLTLGPHCGTAQLLYFPSVFWLFGCSTVMLESVALCGLLLSCWIAVRAPPSARAMLYAVRCAVLAASCGSRHTGRMLLQHGSAAFPFASGPLWCVRPHARMSAMCRRAYPMQPGFG